MAGDYISVPTWGAETFEAPSVVDLSSDASTSAALPVPEWPFKRCVDFLGALVLLAVLLPAMLVISALLGCLGGPVLFRHHRIGRHGREFPCYKFRTMVTNGNEVLKQLFERDPGAREQWDRERKLCKDPRVTPLGNFLRKSSLDELPQLFNVLKGEMSLVGPRPVVHQELAHYGRTASVYIAVRPGITGLWQVSGRNNIGYTRRVAMDRYYVRKLSPWLDFVILLKTVRVVLFRRGAY